MKKLLTTLLLCSTTAFAGNPGPSNLKDVAVCFSRTNVQLDGDFQGNVKLQTDLYSAVDNRLIAYKIKREDCLSPFYDLYIQLDSVKSPSGLTIYTISFDVYSSFIVKGLASIYSVGYFGSQGNSSDVPDALQKGLLGLVDKFAADYALANP